MAPLTSLLPQTEERSSSGTSPLRRGERRIKLSCADRQRSRHLSLTWSKSFLRPAKLSTLSRTHLATTRSRKRHIEFVNSLIAVARDADDHEFERFGAGIGKGIDFVQLNGNGITGLDWGCLRRSRQRRSRYCTGSVHHVVKLGLLMMNVRAHESVWRND